jgi:hypothetical protein
MLFEARRKVSLEQNPSANYTGIELIYVPFAPAEKPKICRSYISNLKVRMSKRLEDILKNWKK